MKINDNSIVGGYLVKNIIVDPIFIINGVIVTFSQSGSSGTPSSVSSIQADSADLIALLNYAFNRIRSLEQALGIDYGPNDIFVPDQVSLLDETLTSGVLK